MLGTIAAVAFVAMRLQLRVFHGRCWLPPEVRSQIGEPDNTVLVPLYALALLATLGGFLGPSAALNPFEVEDAVSNSFANFLAPMLGFGTGEVPGATELGLSALVTALSATGALLAWYIIHERPEISARLREAVPLGVVARRLGVAPIYDFAIVRPAFWLSDRVLHRGIERAGIDGLVLRGSTRALRGLATGALRRAHSGLARGALLWMVLGCLAIASYLAA